MKNYFVSKKSLNNAKNLRKNMTDAEKILWFNIRNSKLQGIKFRRQVPIGVYIADFVCEEKKFIIELDGAQHIDRAEYDSKRTKFLENLGYSVLRFNNDDVLKNTDSVLENIYTSYLNL